jgi:single-strand selective monofunctional uracil DNA glycosylase
LGALLAALQPEWLIGIGDFATQRAADLCRKGASKLGRILHPSPANPAANRNWSAVATRQLRELGVWD